MSRQPRTEDLPDRVIVDQHGHYWRDYGAFLSMPPISDENNQTEVAVVYVRAVRRESRDGSGPARYVASEDEAASPVPAPTLDVERLKAAIETLAHGHCCWDADLDSRDLAAAYIALATPDTETAE